MLPNNNIKICKFSKFSSYSYIAKLLAYFNFSFKQFKNTGITK